MDEQQEIRIIESVEQPTLGFRQVVRMQDLPALFERMIPRAAGLVERAGARPAGPPYARYRGHLGDGVDVEVGFPVVEPVREPAGPGGLPGAEEPDGGVAVADALPEARVVEVVHVGSYETLPDTYARLESWMTEHDLRSVDQSWELYEAGPESDPDPATWRTRIAVAVAGPAVEA
ncbi:GyrI-like domain-containing protein [Isoptericola sp. BMS4]|uniref:GyrI-like domain-containing protein n=1 Tax=Isoptericola sp. BMS4 TaxID=2527875 RepID=UPI0014242292|nr:GyrI-like domain-containing protein [Isoptericola sp. BMS4]